MFSPKVLDRGNVIEFRVSFDDIENFLTNSDRLDLNALDGKGTKFASGFLKAAEEGTLPLGASEKSRFNAETTLFFLLLVEHGGEFGYRVVNEAARFMQAYKMLGGYSEENSGGVPDQAGRDWFDHGFDAVVIQKFLPKIHGSKGKIGPLLRKLYVACLQAPSDQPRDAKIYAAELNKDSATGNLTEPTPDGFRDARYPLSAEKISRMWRQLNENGFAAFSEN